MRKQTDYRPVAAHLLISIWLILAASCSTSQIETTARLSLEAKLVDVLVQSGDPADTVISANLNEYELNQVIQALDAYQLVRGRWQNTMDSAGNAAINILLLKDDYQHLVTQYMVVYNIAQSHWEDYTLAQQLVLTGYHNRAVSLGNAVQVYLQNEERQQALSTALEIGLMLARIAAV